MQKYEFHLTRESLAKFTGASVEEIMRYEQHGMLPIVHTRDDRVLFRPNAVETVRFIRSVLRLGFSVEEVCMMISLIEIFGGGGDYVGAVIHDRILAVRKQISNLLAMEKELMQFERRCVSDFSFLSSIASVPADCGLMQA